MTVDMKWRAYGRKRLRSVYGNIRALALSTVDGYDKLLKKTVSVIEIQTYDLPKTKQGVRYGSLFPMKLTFKNF
jgi:hypothetical protein